MLILIMLIFLNKIVELLIIFRYFFLFVMARSWFIHRRVSGLAIRVIAITSTISMAVFMVIIPKFVCKF